MNSRKLRQSTAVMPKEEPKPKFDANAQYMEKMINDFNTFEQ